MIDSNRSFLTIHILPVLSGKELRENKQLSIQASMVAYTCRQKDCAFQISLDSIVKPGLKTA